MSAGQDSTVTHYAASSMGDALCGANDPRTDGIAALKADTTCPDCLALLAEAAAARPASNSESSEVRVPLPGSGFMVTYRAQGERDRTLRLAEARQQLAHEGNGNPTWQELTDDERGTSELSARNWLRAAERAGLLAEQGHADDDTETGDRRPYMDKPHHGPDYRPAGYGVQYRLADESPEDRAERDDDTEAERALDAYLAGDPEA